LTQKKIHKSKNSNQQCLKEEDNDSKKFQKLSDREHILARPDMYCGSTSKVSKTIHVMNKKGEIEEKTVNISPAMIQVICEAASDRVSARYEPNSNIQIKTSKIDIDVSEDAQISVLNDGDGVPCEYIEKYKMYAPELIFGHLRHRITTTMNKGSMSGEMVLVSKPLIFSQRICQ